MNFLKPNNTCATPKLIQQSIRILGLFTAFLIVAINSKAQAPSNDEPCNAINLTPASTCVYQTFTNLNSTASAGVPAPGCANYQSNDVWFSVTVPAGGAIIIDSKEGTMTDGAMAIYKGTCSSLTLISCDDDSSPNGLMPLITATGLTPGSTIWIRFWTYGTTSPRGTFGICVTIPPPPPANDEPCNAIGLTAASSCTYSFFTNESATASTGMAAPGCATFQTGDVWFSITVPAGGALVFDTKEGTIINSGMAIYRGANCNSLVLITCDDNSSANPLMSKINATGLTPGSTVWVRVWSNGTTVKGTFGICVVIPPPPPANDDPCNAISLTATTTCNYDFFTNESATPSTGMAAPGCATYVDGDVWFSVTVPSGGALIFDTKNGAMTNGGLAIYRGNNCNSLVLITCDDNSSSNPLMGKIIASGLVPGSTIWIRVWSNGTTPKGTFGICVQIPPPPPANDEPCNAIILSPANSCNFQFFTTQSATASTGMAAPGCANFVDGDVWFKVTIPAGGALDFDMQVGTMLDGGMAIYRGTNCNSLVLLSCDDNSSANPLMPYISVTGQTPGNTLWVRVWAKGAILNAGTFGICVTIPAAQPTSFSFNCAKDTTIGCGGSSCFSISSTIPNIHASSSSYVVNPLSGPGNCFSPYISPGVPGVSTSLTIDDKYTALISIPFTFPFYGINYNDLVVSTNGYISFDPTKANASSHYAILNNAGALSATTGSAQDLPSILYDRALIMGPYHDIDPAYTTSPSQKIKYNVTGIAPHRKWILSFYKVPLFYSTDRCDTLINNTHQIVLYEGTGIIEVFVFDKQNCLGWNQGRAMIGLQNYNRDQAIMAPGRKASDAPWGQIGLNESWRFVPASGPSLFKRVELYDTSGNLLATGDTSSINASKFRVNFNNVCPATVTAGVTTYIIKSVYAQFNNPAVEIFGIDTFRVTRGTQLSANYSVTNANCNGGTGTISINTTSGTAPYQYSSDGGTNFQTSNLFNLPAGTYNVRVKDNSNCSKDTVISITQPLAIAANYTVTAAKCFGANDGTISINASNGTAPFQYSVNGGTVYQSGNSFTLSAGTYNVRIKDNNNCTKDTSIVVAQPAAITATYTITNVKCNGGNNGTISINANGGTVPYQYSVDGGTVYQTANSFNVSAGTFTVRIKDINNCTKDTSIVVGQPVVLSANASSVNASCNPTPNGTITVNASGGTMPFSYSLDAIVFQTSNQFTVGQGNYIITIKDANNCTATITSTVGFTFDLTLMGRADTSICDNIAVRLNTVSNALTYSWTPVTNLDNPSVASPMASPIVTTDYFLLAQKGTCQLRDTVRITVSPSPIVFAGNDITVVKGDDATINASVSNTVSYTWSPTTYLNNANTLSPVAMAPQQTITYRLTAVNNEGCSKYDEVQIIVLPYCIKTKNAFTPNGDGVNDTWMIYDQFDCLKNVKVQVFNRYGSRVYQSANYRNDWRGTYNGKPLPDATYYYLIDFELITGRVLQVRGDVTILR